MRIINPNDYKLPYDEIHAGFYSAAYFTRGSKILENLGMEEAVTMQVFQKRQSMIAGLNEAAAILKVCSNSWDDIVVNALPEGSVAQPWETVMTIEGPLRAFMHLESVYLGILRDATTVATNTMNIVQAANGKPVICMADRFNGFENQARQGAAALLAGASSVVTPAGVSRVVGQEAMGTMPHALIAAFDGDVVHAAAAFQRAYPDVKLIALVDFNNDCVHDALKCADAFGNNLFAVRLDTSEKMVDESIKREPNLDPYLDDTILHGVCPKLVHNVRNALDEAGHSKVKIAVSGGFNVNKVTKFEQENVPVDIYGVGSSILQGGSDFTADVVVPVAKVGRRYNPNPKLELIN